MASHQAAAGKMAKWRNGGRKIALENSEKWAASWRRKHGNGGGIA